MLGKLSSGIIKPSTAEMLTFSSVFQGNVKLLNWQSNKQLFKKKFLEL